MEMLPEDILPILILILYNNVILLCYIGNFNFHPSTYLNIVIVTIDIFTTGGLQELLQK